MQHLQYGEYYHIYNRGNNRENLFRTDENYQYFLRLYEKYIFPVADTFAWVLMKNHFHILVRIKDQKEIDFKNLSDFKNKGTDLPKEFISKQFSNLFNAYTKAFNKYFARTGSLFEKPFKRIHIDSEQYFERYWAILTEEQILLNRIMIRIHWILNTGGWKGKPSRLLRPARF